MFDAAAPDFSDPIGMLQACHGRIQAQCELLRRMSDYQGRHGVDQELTSAAQRVLRYFDIAAPQHHADEEQQLFPALAGNAELQSLIQRLTAEHAEHDRLWQVLRLDLQRIMGGRPSRQLHEHSEPFIQASLAHVSIENRRILPHARASLDAQTLRKIGEAMAQRRQNAL